MPKGWSWTIFHWHRPRSSIIPTPRRGEYRELQQLYGTENRIWVSYDDIPLDLVHAAISIEDKRFPTHKGVDWIPHTGSREGLCGRQLIVRRLDDHTAAHQEPVTGG
ncbi:MAG: transglycosylase domain-containing protein [Oscillospiraceae bacterium]